MCHSESVTKDGLLPASGYPRVPGHEVIGVVGWQLDLTFPTGGPASGSAWVGMAVTAAIAKSCRRGKFITCANALIPGVSYDGGYADYMIAPFEALAAVPDNLTAADAAPLMCAGITTFNALRNSGVGPGDVAAVLGIGGLGHLGVQFAAKMGCRTVAVARGMDKEPLARQSGRPPLHRQQHPGRCCRTE